MDRIGLDWIGLEGRSMNGRKDNKSVTNRYTLQRHRCTHPPTSPSVHIFPKPGRRRGFSVLLACLLVLLACLPVMTALIIHPHTHPRLEYQDAGGGRWWLAGGGW